jgi:NIPSNAP
MRKFHFARSWSAVGLALFSFAAGCLVSARFLEPAMVRAENSRTFQLMVYHNKPGKAAELESVFRDVAKLQTQHNLDVVGYWVPANDSAWKDTFLYLVAHRNTEEAKKNWDALHSDPAFPPYRKAAAPLIEQINGAYRVEEILMRPSEYSALK